MTFKEQRNSLLLYSIPAIMAPILFRALPAKTAGHIGGPVFIASGIFAFYLLKQFGAKKIILAYAGFNVFMEIAFWGWRFIDPVALPDTSLLGVPGKLWHVILTTLYLILGFCLYYFRRQPVR